MTKGNEINHKDELEDADMYTFEENLSDERLVHHCGQLANNKGHRECVVCGKSLMKGMAVAKPNRAMLVQDGLDGDAMVCYPDCVGLYYIHAIKKHEKLLAAWTSFIERHPVKEQE